MTPPPPGPPWDLPVHEAPLAFVDLEMTGLDVSRDRVIEVCIERWVGTACIRAVRSVINPADAALDVGATVHVHGIEASEIAAAPAFSAIADEARDALEGAVFVAHAAAWDAKFLEREFGRLGRAFSVVHWLDTLVLARRAFVMRSHSLDALCRELGIERGRAHRADSDVRALRELFARCVGVLAPRSVRDLWEVRVGEREPREAIVAACRAAAERGSPVIVTYRAARRAPEPLTMILVEVRADLDPPMVVGYLLPGRGRRQLRADRILRVDTAPAS